MCVFLVACLYFGPSKTKQNTYRYILQIAKSDNDHFWPFWFLFSVSLLCRLCVCFACLLSIRIYILSRSSDTYYLDSSLFYECEMDFVSNTMKMSNVTFGISVPHFSHNLALTTTTNAATAIYSLCACVQKKHFKCTVQFTRHLFSLTWHLILPSVFHLINFAFIFQNAPLKSSECVCPYFKKYELECDA